MTSTRRTFQMGVPLALLGAWTAHGAGVAPIIAGASDMQFALEELAQRFHKESGWHVRLVFGSSGTLSAQIRQGAPFELFLSADENLVFGLADAGVAVNRGRIYALGRIGILVPHGSPLLPDGSLTDLAASLKDGRLKAFAIANPTHAPYGLRAKEALTKAGLWAGIEPHVVMGDNVSQAAQFALGGSSQGGIVAHSLALAPALANQGHFGLIAEDWHQPLRQRMVLLRSASTAAKAFHDFLASAASSTVLRRHGFALP